MKIRQTILVGCGGTGGWLAEPAARLLRYSPNAKPYFILVDNDTFEPKNEERQSCGLTDENKASYLLNRLDAKGLGRDAALDAVEAYIEGLDLLQIIANLDYAQETTREDGVVCVILAVDNDFTRASLIEAMLGSEHDFIIINPGNGYDTFQCSAMGRVCGVPLGDSLIERYPQYVDPALDAPQHIGCQEETESTPQLLTANMASATAALCVLETFLSGNGLVLDIKGKTRDVEAYSMGTVTTPTWEACMATVTT